MFKSKQLDKLVAAGIITSTQKSEILEFKDNSSVVAKALNLLGLFMIGLGGIGIVAANWDIISPVCKLISYFSILFLCSGLIIYWQRKGFDEYVEKAFFVLFLFIGAGIGLIIQIFQLGGSEIYVPLGLWCFVSLPLLLYDKHGYVAHLWIPLFLIWFTLYVLNIDFSFLMLMLSYLLMSLVGYLLRKYIPHLHIGNILSKEALVAFYIAIALYSCLFGFWEILIAAAILLGLSVIYYFSHYVSGLRRNIIYGGLIAVSAYFHLAYDIGLLESGLGLIISGGLLIVLLHVMPKFLKLVKKENTNA